MNGFKTTKRIAFLMFACILISAFITKDKDKIKLVDFKNFYDSINTKGCMVIYDTKNKTYYLYDSSTLNKVFTPASTFKIPSTLMALETGTATDENFEIKWDSIERWSPNWSKDHTLKMAFQNSTVWYYQELARRVGQKQMDFWIKKADYGNHSTKGGIDKFWLEGDLRISPKQQLDFLIKLHDNKLPFSQKNMDIVKDIMIVRDTLNTVIHAKTGWGQNGKEDIGWFVGYVEKGENVYYFANCLQTTDFNNEKFGPARKEIVYDILDELKILKR